MPTSSGYDRNNYSTTYNFSSMNAQSTSRNGKSTHLLSPNERSQSNSTQSNYYKVAPNRPVANKVEYVRTVQDSNVNRAPITVTDPTAVRIKDPNMRDMIKKLVAIDAENKRNNVDDSNTVTQIDHMGYKLLYTRSNIDPMAALEKRGGGQYAAPKETKSVQTDLIYPQYQQVDTYTNVVNQPTVKMVAPMTSYVPVQVVQQHQVVPAMQTVQSVQTVPYTEPVVINYEDKTTGAKYELTQLNTNSTTTINNGAVVRPETTTKNYEIPPEVNKIIEQDLAKNPLGKSGERAYRVVINKNITNPNGEPQVIRVVVKDEHSLSGALSNPSSPTTVRRLPAIANSNSTQYVETSNRNTPTRRRNSFKAYK